MEIGAAHFDIGSDNTGVGSFQIPIGFSVLPGTSICVKRCGNIAGGFGAQVYGYFLNQD